MLDRNDTPGLRATPLDVSSARQLTRHYVESTAVHSRSQGWLPMVKLGLHHIPLVGGGEVMVTELLLDREAIRGLILALRAAADRADEDAARGLLPDDR
jgi:hypothetical protein